MTRRFPALLALAALALLPRTAHASGAWTTYMRVTNCNDIVALADTVWIATREAGLVRYSRSADRFESLTREPGGLASNHVTALEYDRSGNLWAGTPGRGASRLSADGARWGLVNAFDGLPSDSVNALRATGDSVWIGTQGGLALWDGEQVAGSVPDLGTPSPFRSNAVRGIVVVHDSVFVGTADGVYVALLSASLATWTALDTGLPNRKVHTMATDGHEVFALADSTTYRWNMTTGQWAANRPAGTYVRLLRDDFGTITCSTPQGLQRWSGTDWVLVPGSPTGTEPFPGEVEFAVDPSRSYFAFRRGLLWIQGSPWTSRNPPGPVGNNLQHVVVDGSRVWANTNSDGVSRFDGASWRNWARGCCGAAQDTSFVNPVGAFTLHRDGAGRKWFAFWGVAVERYDDSVDPPHVDRLVLPAGGPDSLYNHTAMWASAHDDSNYVYLGGDTWDRGPRPPVGIDVYAPDGTLRAVWKTTNAGLPDNQVRALVVDTLRRRIWAGFAGKGVAWASTTGHKDSTRFQPLAGTGTFDIFGMALRGEALWVLTTTNLRRYSASSYALVSILDLPGAPAPLGAMNPLAISPDGTAWVGSVDGVRRYRVGGGYDDYKVANSPLANDEVRAIAVDPATGVVWFATAGGLSRFDPGYTPPPPPSISSLRLVVYPNPAQFPAVGLDLKLSGNAASYTGEIYDLAGRVVHRFYSGANARVVWDGCDLEGRRVRPGVYFVRAHGGGHQASARVVVLR